MRYRCKWVLVSSDHNMTKSGQIQEADLLLTLQQLHERKVGDEN